MYNNMYFYFGMIKCRSLLIYVFTILTLLLCYTFPCYAAWQKSDIGFAFEEQKQIIIGDGRSDGVSRIYSGGDSGCAGNIYEFSFFDNEWQKVKFGDSLCEITGLDVGVIRNDAVRRIYASGYNLAEYYYSGASWLGGEIGPYIQWTNDLVLGNARNDGKARIYVAEWDGITELTYNNGSWDAKAIDTGGQWVEKLLITDGRHDGVLRLYAAMRDHVYEYSWSGSQWQVNDCGGADAIIFYDMVAGKGRNDGINRIYLAANWGGIYELSYNQGKWKYIVIANPAPSGNVSTVAVGNGRDDGKERVYASYHSYDEDHMGEFTYSGGTWSETSNIESDLVVNGIVIGKGRNDNVNRIYVTGGDNHVYEYSFETSVPIPDVKANGSDGPLHLCRGQKLLVQVALNPGDYAGTNADWWLSATTPFGVYWYTLNNKKWQHSIKPIRAYGGPLVSLKPYTVLEMSTLPLGEYMLSFAVDDDMDGVRDATYVDEVAVTVNLPPNCF